MTAAPACMKKPNVSSSPCAATRTSEWRMRNASFARDEAPKVCAVQRSAGVELPVLPWPGFKVGHSPWSSSAFTSLPRPMVILKPAVADCSTGEGRTRLRQREDIAEPCSAALAPSNLCAMYCAARHGQREERPNGRLPAEDRAYRTVLALGS
mmetsp:Transcript_33210/g.87583  ORF Transcript_33210/g.87583 Transcript_33210/m.87583 type:complete len:153 (+) Transcript_33210:1334-1792(+)